ncbi:ada2a-containing complex component 3 isoform d [Anaeramoeba ignava]|uniref:Ada2a-containing complex component 3 isoform d n=1 Tax=Anaeramoeba ignava TaxID=1746090 RepID=A0A9Q0R9C6_ANAIG|nr:ada2a-containing complex component 3 isoform d [Anaeramoeba ignava]
MDKKKQKETLLQIACRNQNKNSFEIIKFFIENGSDVNVKNKKNQTALHIVCQSQKKPKVIELIKLLISKGADINAKNDLNQTPLHLACQFQNNKENSFRIIKYLVKKGADVNAQNFENEITLHLACQYQHNKSSFDVVKYLIENDSSVNATNRYNQTPLHLACQFQNKHSLEIIKYLLENGANINAKTQYNQTPLHFACHSQYEKSFEVVKYLLENGADINAKTIYNQTPLHLASQCQNTNSFTIVKYLIEKGADVNAKNNRNQTALHLACQFQNDDKNSFQIVKFLLEKDADIDSKDSINQTPLDYSICENNIHSIALLIMNDANVFELKESEITKEIVDLFPKIYSINQDLNNLLNSNDNFPDFEIETNDPFKFKVHKQILLLRFDHNEINIQKFINNCKNKSKKVVEIVINFIYTGFPNFDNFIQRFQNLIEYKNQFEQIKSSFETQKISVAELMTELFTIDKSKKEIFEKKSKKQNEINEEFFKEIGLNSNWIKSKSKRKGIIKDLSKLYKENDSKKDFTIICENGKEIKIHKLILFLRSELFKGMFQLNIRDTSNEVQDYSRKSFETLNQFIYFLYHDGFEENKINPKIIEELEDIKDYYQLNQNSIIDLILFELISSN